MARSGLGFREWGQRRGRRDARGGPSHSTTRSVWGRREGHSPESLERVKLWFPLGTGRKGQDAEETPSSPLPQRPVPTYTPSFWVEERECRTSFLMSSRSFSSSRSFLLQCKSGQRRQNGSTPTPRERATKEVEDRRRTD